MGRWVAIAVLLIGGLLWPIGAQADQPCEVVPMPCTFEALPFKFTVVDGGTQQPVAGVHALAEWQVHGPGGRLNGPLMVLDAVSGGDGLLSFPGWGPTQGPLDGIGIGRDPVITLFKTGYKALEIYNGDPPGTKETQRVRRFGQDGRTYALEPFHGTPPEWLKELERVYAGRAFSRSDDQSLKFRTPYLTRLKLISAERDKTPADEQRVGRFFWHVDRTLKLLEEGHR